MRETIREWRSSFGLLRTTDPTKYWQVYTYLSVVVLALVASFLISSSSRVPKRCQRKANELSWKRSTMKLLKRTSPTWSKSSIFASTSSFFPSLPFPSLPYCCFFSYFSSATSYGHAHTCIRYSYIERSTSGLKTIQTGSYGWQTL